MSQITEPLRSLPDDPVGEAAETEFPTVLRGYDKFAVDAYVQRTNQLIAELQSRSTPQAAVRRALERVGEDVSGILQRAHETAEGITATSRREAEDRLEAARREAAELTARARARVTELDADTDRIWAERDRIVGDARDLARQLVELASEAAARFPADEETGETTGEIAIAGDPAPGELGFAAPGLDDPPADASEASAPAFADLVPEADDESAAPWQAPEVHAPGDDLDADAGFHADAGEDPAAVAGPDEDPGADVAADPGEAATEAFAPGTETFEPFDADTAEHQALPGELRFSRGPSQGGATRRHGLWDPRA